MTSARIPFQAFISLLLTMFALTSSAQPTHVVLIDADERLRCGAGTAYYPVAQPKAGVVLAVRNQTQNGWFEVSYPRGIDAIVPASRAEVADDGAVVLTEPDRLLALHASLGPAASWAKLLPEPLPAGTRLFAAQGAEAREGERWIRVQSPSEATGFIRVNAVRPATRAEINEFLNPTPKNDPAKDESAENEASETEQDSSEAPTQQPAAEEPASETVATPGLEQNAEANQDQATQPAQEQPADSTAQADEQNEPNQSESQGPTRNPFAPAGQDPDQPQSAPSQPNPFDQDQSISDSAPAQAEPVQTEPAQANPFAPRPQAETPAQTESEAEPAATDQSPESSATEDAGDSTAQSNENTATDSPADEPADEQASTDQPASESESETPTVTEPPAQQQNAQSAPQPIQPAPAVSPAELDGLFAIVRRQPTLEAEFDQLLSQYARTIAELEDKDDPEQIATLETLKTQRTLLEIRRTIQRERINNIATARRAEQTRREAESETARFEQARPYDVVGVIQRSIVYNGTALPQLFRIVSSRAGESGLTLAYVEDSEEFRVSHLVGRTVGVRGQFRPLAGGAVRVIEPRVLETVDPRRAP